MGHQTQTQNVKSVNSNRTHLRRFCLIPCAQAHAELRVANLFGDHMVLQQNQPIRGWGWAEPGSKVTGDLTSSDDESTATANVNQDGKWLTEFKPRKAEGKKLSLSIHSGNERIKFDDILMGEVWICSGQSNMEWRVTQAANPQEEISKANHPMIRFYDVPEHVKQNKPQEDAQENEWKLCSPETIGGFSAVGYYFGRRLQQELDLPIGLIGTNWGGQRIEPFTPPTGFEQVPELADYVKDLESGKFKGGATQIYNGMVADSPHSVFKVQSGIKANPMQARPALQFERAKG